jgi:hypothetical protein
LPLTDLARAIPGILLAVLLPGYALATLLAPRWRAWTRLAASPGLSAGFFGVLGLGMRLVHIQFEPLTVIPAIVVLCGAAVIRRRGAGSIPEATVPWWTPIPAVVAGCLGAAGFAWALRGQVLPPDWDGPVHAAMAASIARAHDVLPLFPIPLQHTAFARARPGFEAMTVVVSWFGGPPPAMSMAPIITAVLVLMPLGFTLLALEATGSVALAVVVPLLAAGMAFPSDQAIFGRYPQVVDSVLIIPYVAATLRLLRGKDVLGNALLLVAFAASIWVVHGLEIFTALLLGAILIASAAYSAFRASPAAALARSGLAAGATIAGAVLVTVLTRLPHTPPPNPPAPTVVYPSISLPVHLHRVAQFLAQADLTSPLAVALYCTGIVAILMVYRRLAWVLVAHLVFVALLVDALFWQHVNSLQIGPFSLYPYGDADRALGLQYWVLPFILGAGFLGFVSVIRTIASERRLWPWLAIAAAGLLALVFHGPLERMWTSVFGGTVPVSLYALGTFEALTSLASWRLLIGLSAVIVVAACVLAFRHVAVPVALRARIGARAATLDAAALTLAGLLVLMLGVGIRAEYDLYKRQAVTRSLSTSADVNVLHQMSAMLAPGTLVLTNSLSDAGVYVTALTDLTPLVPNGSELDAFGLPLVTALSHACSSPAAAEQAVQTVGAVFVGSHPILLDDPAAPWSVSCIAALPNLRLIASDRYQGQQAAGFVVVR